MKIKAIVSLILVLILTFACCGCADDGEDSTVTSVAPLKHSVDILAIAKKGQIPEVPYKLGHDIDDLKATFMDHVESGSEIYELAVQEGENTVRLLGGNVTFCYEKANAANGISVIVAQEYAYDFALGGVYDAEDIIHAVGSEDYTRAAATDDDVFFMFATPENCECITYTAGEYLLKFIMVDGYLSVVTLTDPNNWN